VLQERLVITLVLGGARSGKSEVAERLASAANAPVTYIATATVRDDDLAARVRRHRDRRPAAWATIEAGRDLVGALRDSPPDHTVLVDSLGTWVASHDGFVVDGVALVETLRARRADTVLVSDEVGLGVHPSTEVGVAFRDALGELNRAVATVADDVMLIVAGCVLPLERR
jgi:adenosyl cobinamide kinase/adenosyl cobinamide phosphate guanylyltransferase